MLKLYCQTLNQTKLFQFTSVSIVISCIHHAIQEGDRLCITEMNELVCNTHINFRTKAKDLKLIGVSLSKVKQVLYKHELKNHIEEPLEAACKPQNRATASYCGGILLQEEFV